MKTLKELVGQLIGTINNDVMYVDSKGNPVMLEDAIKGGIMVKPISPKQEAIKELQKVGIDVTDKKFIKDLWSLVESLTGGATKQTTSGKRTRTTYTDDQKEALVNEYKNSGMSKRGFVKQKGLSYQTLVSWIR